MTKVVCVYEGNYTTVMTDFVRIDPLLIDFSYRRGLKPLYVVGQRYESVWSEFNSVSTVWGHRIITHRQKDNRQI